MSTSTSTNPEAGFVAVNGTQLYYEVLGDGPPLVLIHGGYLDCRMWDDQFSVFAQHYRVVRYDVRGFGKSALPQIPYSDEHDLFTLLQALGMHQTALVGLSLGGRIATDFALQYPDMVRALVLVGSPVGGITRQPLPTNAAGEPQLPPAATAFAKAKHERDIPGLVEALMANPTLVPSPEYPVARQRVREYLADYSFAWVLDPAPRQELDPPACERLADVHVPTLIILGSDDDPGLFRHADILSREIVGAKRATIAKTHHMPNIERPEAFNTLVLEFLGTQ